MADKSKVKQSLANRRRRRVRGKITGTAERPRLTVCKTLKHMYVQIIDDSVGTTLAASSTKGKDVAPKISSAKNKTEEAKLVGTAIAEVAKEKGITAVVFDRNKSQYHGRVRALAEAAREGGLNF